MVGEKTGAHEYPSVYPPGKHWAIDAAWEILDVLRPGRLTLTERALLAGMIAGRLDRERNEAEKKAKEET